MVTFLRVSITEKEIEAIQKGLNNRGVSEVIVKIESGQVVVLQVEKKKIL